MDKQLYRLFNYLLYYFSFGIRSNHEDADDQLWPTTTEDGIVVEY